MCKFLFLPKSANRHLVLPTIDSTSHHATDYPPTRPTTSYPHPPIEPLVVLESHPVQPTKQSANSQQPPVSTISSLYPPSFPLRPIDFKLAKLFTNHNIFIMKLIDSNRCRSDLATPLSLNCECRLSVCHPHTA